VCVCVCVCPTREADHSPPFSAKVKECVKLYLHSPNPPSWHGASLKHRDNFTLLCVYVRARAQDGGGSATPCCTKSGSKPLDTP
jgi:hypothetical protein